MVSKRFWFLSFFLVLWTLIAKFIILNFLIYFLSFENFTLSNLSESVNTFNLFTAPVTAATFLILLRYSHPDYSNLMKLLAPNAQTLSVLPRGMWLGSGLGIGFVVSFLASPYYSFIGSGLHESEDILAIIARASMIGVWIYLEEFLYRGLIQKSAGHSPKGILLTTLLYVFIKNLQFDLGLIQSGTLFIISLLLSTRSFVKKDFSYGAFFWASFLVVIHAFSSLNILGTESTGFSGVLLMRYTPPSSITQSFDAKIAQILTGGYGGPLSSILLQLVAVFLLMRIVYTHKKTLLNSKQSSIL